MIKIVEISKKNMGGIASQYAIDLDDLHATDKDYFDAAWEYAIDDFMVDPSLKSDFEFSICKFDYPNQIAC